MITAWNKKPKQAQGAETAPDILSLIEGSVQSGPPTQEPDILTILEGRGQRQQTDPTPTDTESIRIRTPEGQQAPTQVGTPTAPASSLTRAGASIKMTPQGVKGFLESVYGPGNVQAVATGEETFNSQFGDPSAKRVEFWDEKTGQYVPVEGAYIGSRPTYSYQVRESDKHAWRDLDPQDWASTFGDTSELFNDFIADQAGLALDVGPMLLTKPTALGAGVGAGLGSMIRQGASAALPGDDQMEWGERVGNVLTAGALGAGAQGLVNSAISGAGRVVLGPKNAWGNREPLGRFWDRKAQPRGQELQLETGIPLTAAQEVGSPGLMQFERTVAQHFLARDKFDAFFTQQMRAAKAYFDKITRGIGRPRGQAETGARVKATFEDIVSKAFDARRANANRLFGTYAGMAEGGGSIRLRQTLQEIGKVADEFDFPGAPPAARKLAAELRGLQTEFGKDLPLTALPALMSRYSAMARGNGTLFDGLARDQSAAISARMMRAIEADLDDVVNASGAVSKLREARDAWRRDTARIRELEESAIGRIVGSRINSAEDVLAKITRMDASEIEQTREILERLRPEIWRDVKAQIMDDWLTARASSSSAAGTAPGSLQFNKEQLVQGQLSPARFIENQPANMKAIFSGQELAKIEAGLEALQRIAYQAGMSGSQTAPMELVMGIMSLIKHPLGVASMGSSYLIERGTVALLRRILLDPNRVAALRELASLNIFAVDQARKVLTARQGASRRVLNRAAGLTAFVFGPELARDIIARFGPDQIRVPPGRSLTINDRNSTSLGGRLEAVKPPKE